LIGYLVTEAGAGSDVQAILSTDKLLHGHYILDGRKTFATNGADASTMIEAGRGLMVRAAIAHDAGNPNTKLASMAKCFCSDAAMKITADMVRVLGGYFLDQEVERRYRDNRIAEVYEGTVEVQLNNMVRMLKRLNPEFINIHFLQS